MIALDQILAAVVGGGLAAAGLGLSGRLRKAQSQGSGAPGELDAAEDAFGAAVIGACAGKLWLAGGEDSFAEFCAILGVARDPKGAVQALTRADPAHAHALSALFERGEACVFELAGPKGAIRVEGRASGAIAWLRLSKPEGGAHLPSPGRLKALVDAYPLPAWIAGGDGAPVFANKAWLAAAGATDLAAARAAGRSFDSEGEALAREAATSREPKELLRWTSFGGARQALRFIALPLVEGGAAVWTQDATEAEELREALKRQAAAHDQALSQISEAAAVFAANRKLVYYNAAFAQLWSLDTAWLAEQPTHSELLDRLRQKRRLPETVDYSRWKAQEMAAYEAKDALPDELWTLPDRRTLRVLRQPHPTGGLLLLFADISGEVRLKAQYNGLIQVQQATLDKLNDAVAVFGSDGRLRLHNDAFLRFWGISAADMGAAGDFEGVVELCVPKLHDMGFWQELKGRLADTDPQARAPSSGEMKLSDGRIAAFQSRPLPDGATLVAFDDVTSARRLEQAVHQREAALKEAETLKRDFVGNVSYELRTPLTTIIGYSELLERTGQSLSDRGRSHVASVRAAAAQLARSIDDVLDMAAIDAGELGLEVEEVRVAELLAGGAERIGKAAEAAQVGVELAVDPDAGVLRGDPRRLGQVLDHLLDNALRQTPPEGTITIRARRAQGVVRLQVSDTGRGIPFHVQAKIFDRFVRREHGGPGLGLALVKELVELHGGWVTLESEPGAGATFTCHLPEALAPSVQRDLAL